ncbi:MAG TPA: nicotinate-nucleotide--dimethylbenzimidazole phosphoribosyltransferase [Candidatus Aquicultor sp.]|jgi:nicotinate-nucleotide--dimethylbenzimidazole phosphoribosyltransferase
MGLLQDTLDNIGLLDRDAMQAARVRQRRLTKPPGSLGVLEDISVQLAGITGSVLADVGNKTIVVMAGDHGVTEEGVSAFPQEVTAQMLLNFVNGGAAINVLAHCADAKVIVVDVGVAADIRHPGIFGRKVRAGTANFARQSAMTRREAIQALEVGIEIADSEIDAGAQLLATGDMGIGNTTASTALLSALTGKRVEEVAGRGTGIEDKTLAHKKAVIEDAIKFHAPNPDDPIDTLAKVGGLEIAALAGLILGAAARRVPVVVDGFISSAAALVAGKLSPQAVSYMIASHVSVEPGHRVILDTLGLKPMLFMDMRLGEGTGAALAMMMVEAASKIIKEMATFGEAGVSDKE